MFLTKLKISAAAPLAVGTAFLLPIPTIGFTQEKPEAKSSPAKVSTRTKAILAKLEKRVSMSFANETPLDDVLKYIKQATTTGQNDPGLPIYVDPIGLRYAKSSLTSTVVLDVEEAPLKVTLPQILKQLNLTYIVNDDVLIITSPQGNIPGEEGYFDPGQGRVAQDKGSARKARLADPDVVRRGNAARRRAQVRHAGDRNSHLRRHTHPRRPARLAASR